MIAQNKVPAEFECPITSEVMEDPVILADGRSYERHAILKWLETSSKSPMTGAVLEHKMVTPNTNLKALIQDWQESHVVEAAAREEQTALQEMPRAELARLRARLAAEFRQEQGLTLVVERAMLVYNDELQTRFDRKAAQLQGLRGPGACPVVTKFHGTTREAASSIAREGFRLPQPDEDGDFVGQGLRVFYTDAQRESGQEHMGDLLMFGQAIYVSTDLEKATRFAQGALLLCKCALGSTLQARTAQQNMTLQKLQSKGHDSIRALPGCQESGGCTFEEFALFDRDQILPTHIVHFRLVQSGVGTLVAQPVAEFRREAGLYTLDFFVQALTGDPEANGARVDEERILACKSLGDVARDDQHKATSKFLSDRKLVSLLSFCARSPNEALQFEALRVWWNFSFNNEGNQSVAMKQLGVHLLTALLDSPNTSLTLRATGLIWNLTQNSEGNRQIFSEAGAVNKLRRDLGKAVEQQQWGLVQLRFGALANFAMSLAAGLRQDEGLLLAAQIASEGPPVPPAVQQQATRFLCNIISEGIIDTEWQANHYSYKTSAPRDSAEACVVR